MSPGVPHQPSPRLQHEEVGERGLLQPVPVATFAKGTGNLKRGKNELKILELDIRSCNEKLQDFKTEKWLAYSVGEVHSCC